MITLRFSLGLALDIAEQEVQAAINAGANLLPTDLPMPPLYAKVNPADAPVLTLAITSPTLPLTQVPIWSRTASRRSSRRSPASGWWHRRRRSARRCASRPIRRAWPRWSLSLEDIRSALGAANVNQAKGSFDGPTRATR